MDNLENLVPQLPGLGARDEEIMKQVSFAMFKALASECSCEVCRALRPAMLKMIRNMPMPEIDSGTDAQQGPQLPRQARRRLNRNG